MQKYEPGVRLLQSLSIQPEKLPASEIPFTMLMLLVWRFQFLGRFSMSQLIKNRLWPVDLCSGFKRSETNLPVLRQSFRFKKKRGLVLTVV
jgi:hypothetical protein